MAEIAALQAAYDEASANAEAALEALIAAEKRVEAAKAAVQPYTDAVIDELGQNASDDDIRNRLMEVLPEEILREVQESQDEESVLADASIAAEENFNALRAALNAAKAVLRRVARAAGGARRIYRKSRKGRINKHKSRRINRH
jgi:hypothetical protein